MKRTLLLSGVCIALCWGICRGIEESRGFPLAGPEKAMRKKIERFRASGGLKDILQRLEKSGGVKMAVDWSGLRKAGVSDDKHIAIDVTDATMGQLLDVALQRTAVKGAPLGWYVEDRVVHVTTQMRVLYRHELLYPRLIPVLRKPTRDKTLRRAAAIPPGVDLRFDRVEIKKVVDYFRALTGINIVVNWASLEQVGLTRETTITLNVRNISVKRGLDLVIDQLSAGRNKLERVYWVADEGVLRIATGVALNDELRVRVFDVSDLLMVTPRAPQPSLGGAFTTFGTNTGADPSSGGLNTFSAPGTTERQTETESRSEQRKRMEDNLTGIIQESIGMDMWYPAGKGSIRIIRGQMIISQTPLGFKLLSEATRQR